MLELKMEKQKIIAGLFARRITVSDALAQLPNVGTLSLDWSSADPVELAWTLKWVWGI